MEKIVSKAVIDRSLFSKKLKVLGCKVPIKLLGDLQKKFKPYLLTIQSLRNILNIEDDKSQKLILLSKDYGVNPDAIPENLKSFISEQNLTIEQSEVELGYDNYTCHEALEKILPKEVVIPTGFETVGHICHMNLSEDQMEHRYSIGQIFLEKNPNIKTVLTKVGFIENVYRTFNFEVIAGEETFETTQNEDGIKFEVDVSKVYWCSRLSMERTRVIEEFFKEGDVVCDMFCGIGPLSVRAAKVQNIKVLANDLNPDCYHYLRKNIVQNKVADLVVPYCMDAREFVRYIIKESHNKVVLDKEEEKKEPKTGKKKNNKAPSQKSQEAKLIPESETISPIPNRSFLHFDHVYMNLPMDAIEFLDVFIGLYNDANPDIWVRTDKPEGMSSSNGLPLIHVYGFTTEKQEKEKALEYFVDRIASVYQDCGGFTKEQILRFHNNRDVSKSSSMYSITFRLPEDVAYSNTHKRQKIIDESEA